MAFHLHEFHGIIIRCRCSLLLAFFGGTNISNPWFPVDGAQNSSGKMQGCYFCFSCMLQMSLEILIGSGILPLSILFLQNLILNGIDLQYQKLTMVKAQRWAMYRKSSRRSNGTSIFLWKRIFFHGRTFLLSVLTAWE